MRYQHIFSMAASVLLLLGGSARADHIEELHIVDQRDRTRIELADRADIAPDAAQLMRAAPGGDVNGNGPLTGIPQYRGMYGSRIGVTVNGSTIGAGGPNWMDPPLSYAPAALLESLEVYRGIAPVSAGQETIGGAIRATTWNGDFSSTDRLSSDGRVVVGGESVNEASLLAVMASLASQQHRVNVAAMDERADDSEFPGGDIVPTEYQRQRVDLGYGFTSGAHSLQLDLAHNETDDSGTPALPMDIQYIDADLATLSYRYQTTAWQLDSRLFYSDIGHGMTNYDLRQAPSAPGRWRRNIATGENIGFGLSARINDGKSYWQLGVDGFNERHNSDIDNPNAAAFFVDNFNNARRRVLGVFVERNQAFGDHWQAELGLRVNRVDMSADEVNGTPAMMMAAAATLRDTFNAADRDHSDDNLDWVARVFYLPGDGTRYYAGLARKSRSASYQERYLWLPLEATAGLADGRTYTGNLGLDAEVAHELELGVDADIGKLQLSPRVFYRKVDDFIQGTVSTNTAAIMFVNMMNMMNSTGNPAPLEFNNVDASFYGLDVEWRYAFSQHWFVGGVINYVRGQRDDIDDNLYRIAPHNMTVALSYEASNWDVALESRLVNSQDKVSATNGEQETAGYGLLSLHSTWQMTTAVRIGAGVDNILDKQYADHLAGYNRAYNEDIALGERLPGRGRSVFLRADYQW